MTALGSVSEPFALNTTSTEGPTFDVPAEPVLEGGPSEDESGTIYDELLFEQNSEDPPLDK